MLFGNKNKILCYVLIYDQVEIIKKSLSFLTKNSDRLEIVVVENPSTNTPKISAFVNELGKKNLISRYYLFGSNITNNAFKVVFEKELSKINKRNYIIQTDGDLVSNSNDWLDEEINIIKNNPEVFACGISLDMSNLPTKTFPEAVNWVPKDVREQNDYYEAITGAHLLMTRGKDFYKFMNWLKETDSHLVDSTVHDYCYQTIDRKWARTRRSVAYHLTWDLYNDRDSAYTKFKDKQGFKNLWNHDRLASYKLTNY